MAEFNLLSVFESYIHVGRLGGAVHDDLDAVALAHHFAGGIVVGMGVGVDGVKKLRPEETRQLDVVVGFVDLRVDDNANFPLLAAEDIRKTAA